MLFDHMPKRSRKGRTRASGATSIGSTTPAPVDEHLAYADLLRRLDLFAGLDRVTLAKLAAYLEPSSCAAGTIIFRQGDPGESFYLVASGSVGVYTAGRSDPEGLRVRTLHAGEPFGEMALLTSEQRTATIRAETDCRVLRLPRSSFLALVRDEPSVALAIAATLSRRLAGSLDRRGEQEGAPDGQADPSAVSGNEPGRHDPPRQAAPATPDPAAGRRRGPRAAGIAGAAIVLAAGWMLPPPQGLSPAAWHALLLLLASVPPLALQALPEGVVALLLACAWVLTGVADATDALSGFASVHWILIVSVLIVGAAIARTGLLYRFALVAASRMRGGFAGEVTALMCAGQLMSPAVPNSTGRVIMIAPMLRELIEALGYAPKSRGAVGLAMAALVGFGMMIATTLTSGTTTLLIAAVLPAETRRTVDWISWTVDAAPFNAILFAGLLGTIIWFYGPRRGSRGRGGGRLRSLALQRALVGPMSREEKIALAVAAGLLAGFLSQPLHHVEPGWVAAIAVGVLATAGLVDSDTLRTVNWNFALLFGVLISLVTVFDRTGLDHWTSGRISGALGDIAASRLEFLALLVALCFAISFVMRWQAAAPLVTITLAPVAGAAGISPIIVGLIATMACNNFILPHQSTNYLSLHEGTGQLLFTHAQTRPLAIAFSLWVLVAALSCIPVWRAMGLM